MQVRIRRSEDACGFNADRHGAGQLRRGGPALTLRWRAAASREFSRFPPVNTPYCRHAKAGVSGADRNRQVHRPRWLSQSAVCAISGSFPFGVNTPI